VSLALKKWHSEGTEISFEGFTSLKKLSLEYSDCMPGKGLCELLLTLRGRKMDEINLLGCRAGHPDVLGALKTLEVYSINFKFASADDDSIDELMSNNLSINTVVDRKGKAINRSDLDPSFAGSS